MRVVLGEGLRQISGAEEIAKEPHGEVAIEGASIDTRAKKLLALDQEARIRVEPPATPKPSARIRERMMELLSSILELKKNGVTPALVFDIDNTLLDTRHRTLAAAKAFSFGGARPLEHASLDDVAYLPIDTCRSLGVHDEPIQRAFAEFFDDFFWRESSFELDQPIAMTIALAKLAHSLGAELYFLTGRTETYFDLTKRMLEANGLEVKSRDHLIMKSAKRDRDGNLEKTEPFKARVLRRLAKNRKKKIAIAGYVTEGARDMRYLQDRVRSVMRYLYLLFPVDEPGYTVRRNAKTLFVPMDHELPREAEVRARAAKS